MDNIMKVDDDMLDTLHLYRPRGEGTAWLFRMLTPPVLVGKPNPRTGRPYGKEIKESLGGLRDLRKAREERDHRLGAIREEQKRFIAQAEGNLEEAVEIATLLHGADPEQRLDAESMLADRADEMARKIERRLTPKLGQDRAHEAASEKAVHWFKVATGERTPFKLAYNQYKADRGKGLSKSSQNNLETAANELLTFAGRDIALQDVTRLTVAGFVTDFLPKRKSPKAPDGQGAATIRKKVSQLAQVWRWAQHRGLLPYSKETPWDDQAPSKKLVAEQGHKRRPFEPQETKQLLAARARGDVLGDLMRIALLTGARFEEIVSLNASQVGPDARYYIIHKGKTRNAARVVPLVDMAREIVRERFTKVDGKGALFPEVPIRKSTDKKSGAPSQAFTRLRREVLGEETNRQLVGHSFRHTWRTAARRAGVEQRTAHDLGGWSRGKDTDSVYDHGLEIEHYEKEQEKVATWLKKNGYF